MTPAYRSRYHRGHGGDEIVFRFGDDTGLRRLIDSEAILMFIKRGTKPSSPTEKNTTYENFQPDGQPDDGSTYLHLQVVSSPYEHM